MATNVKLNLNEACRSLALRAPKVEPDFDIAAPQDQPSRAARLLADAILEQTAQDPQKK